MLKIDSSPATLVKTDQRVPSSLTIARAPSLPEL
jgi:hypothetical protein